MSKFSSSEELIFERWRTVVDIEESSTTRRSEQLRQGVTCVRVEIYFLAPSSDGLLSIARTDMHPR